MEHDAENRPRTITRIGVRYIKRLKRWERASQDEVLHVLDESERREVLKTERRAVLAGGVIGTLAAVLAVVGQAGVNLAAELLYGSEPNFGWWVGVGLSLALIVAITVVEVVLVFRTCLRASHRMAIEAGVDLGDETGESQAILASLVEAALQMPVSRSPLLGVDPLARSSRTTRWLAVAIYKGKVFITTQLLRLVLKRLLSRVAVRAYLPWVGVPVTAFWDAWICAAALRTGRIRLFARSAIADLIERSRATWTAEPALREVLLRTAACTAVEKGSIHDGLKVLLLTLGRDLPPLERPTDPAALRASLDLLSAGVVPIASAAIRLIAVSDGRCQSRVITLWSEVLRVERRVLAGELRAVRRSFVGGTWSLDPDISTVLV